MANYKMVLLKDPISGDYLIPKMPDTIDAGTLGGHSADDFYLKSDSVDASSLGGKPASDYLLRSEYTPVDMSSYLKITDADSKYAAINHNHDTIYALISHHHEMSQINGIETALAGKASTSHTHSASQITSGTLSVSRGGTGATSLSSLANSLSSYLSGSSGGNIAIAYGTSITASFTIRCAIYTAYYGSVDKCGIWMATESCTRRMGDLSGADVDFTISGRTCNCDTKWVTDPMLVVFG